MRTWEIVTLTEVDSTNRWAADARLAGAPEGLVVVADTQLAGRGRLGRRWVAPAGAALLCSIVLRPPLPEEERHLVPLALALGAHDAIAAASTVPVVLKWPNDLLVGERKLAGILAEVVPSAPGAPTAADAPAADAVVVGIGVNLSFPDDYPSGEDAELLVNATTLQAEGAPMARDDLLAGLLGAFDARYEVLVAPGGATATLAEYGRACSTIGRRVRVITEAGEWSGRAESLGDTGRLLVRRGTELVTIDAADIVHLRSE